MTLQSQQVAAYFLGGTGLQVFRFWNQSPQLIFGGLSPNCRFATFLGFCGKGVVSKRCVFPVPDWNSRFLENFENVSPEPSKKMYKTPAFCTRFQLHVWNTARSSNKTTSLKAILFTCGLHFRKKETSFHFHKQPYFLLNTFFSKKKTNTPKRQEHPHELGVPLPLPPLVGQSVGNLRAFQGAQGLFKGADVPQDGLGEDLSPESNSETGRIHRSRVLRLCTFWQWECG